VGDAGVGLESGEKMTKMESVIKEAGARLLARVLDQSVGITATGKGFLRVTQVEPSPAELLVRGESVGKVPNEIEVPAGELEVELRAEGYFPWRGRVTVKSGESVTMEKVRLQARPVTLLIQSRQGGLEIRVGGGTGGKVVGKTLENKVVEINIDSDTDILSIGPMFITGFKNKILPGATFHISADPVTWAEMTDSNNENSTVGAMIVIGGVISAVGAGLFTGGLEKDVSKMTIGGLSGLLVGLSLLTGGIIMHLWDDDPDSTYTITQSNRPLTTHLQDRGPRPLTPPIITPHPTAAPTWSLTLLQGTWCPPLA